MNSCLYECQIMHHRFAPKPHRFVYRIFLFALDLDELDPLDRKLRLFSFNRRNLYSFQDKDFLPTHEPRHNRPGPTPDVCHILDDKHPALKSRVVACLAGRGVDLTGGRVLLVTLPRVFGYLFNPVSFYFCYDRHGEPVASIAEVTNTFKEMKPFVLGPECRGPATENGGPKANPSSVLGSLSSVFRLRLPKYFYVSPFTDMDVSFDFTLRTPGEGLSVQIDDYDAGRRTLTSALRGSRRPLTDGRLLWFTLKYPFVTLQVIALIHWNALKLYLKNVPWFAKSARPGDQRDLYRPHLSIAHHPDA